MKGIVTYYLNNTKSSYILSKYHRTYAYKNSDLLNHELVGGGII